MANIEIDGCGINMKEENTSMAKKKLIFMLPAMRIGGAEKIALNFLNELKEYFDITVCLNKMEGELLSGIPEGICCIEDPIMPFREIIRQDVKKHQLRYLTKDMSYYFRVKKGKDTERDYRYLIGRTPSIEHFYDVAIGYVANVSTQIFSLADRVKASIKIAWIHGETNELIDTKFFESIYSCFDKIYCVSETCKQHFLTRYPSCYRITDVYYNPINQEDIISKSKQSVKLPYSKDYINILSVGRISPEKGFDMIPHILSVLLERGLKARWYLIGDGPYRAEIESISRNVGTEGLFKMLGTITNPYPYIAHCDIYVQPSYEEGYSTTICEAGILGRAIVGTKTSGGIREQVEDKQSALLANPNPQDIAAAIEQLVVDISLRQKIQKNVLNKDYSHKGELSKMLDFIMKSDKSC